MSIKKYLLSATDSQIINNSKDASVILDNNNRKVFTNSQEDVDDIERTALFIVYLVIFILVLFIIGFMYNLIKCYLPKWLNKQKGNNYNHNDNSHDMKNIPYEPQRNEDLTV